MHNADYCSNAPTDIIANNNDVYVFLNYELTYGSNTLKYQYMLGANSLELVAYRFYLSNTGNWSDWKAVKQEKRTKIEIGVGKEYTTLYEGMIEAFNRGNCDVYIGTGTYDLISEDVPTKSIQGISLGKNCRYYFSSGSKVVCHYTGDNEDIQTNFSCFASFADYGDFEMYNCTIEASKIRYCVHDDNGSETDVTPYRHVFNGCNMTIDNENSVYETYHCIGGGLGAYGNVVIQNCYFNSVNSSAGESAINGDVSYHGNWANTTATQQGKSNLIVTNNYFEHNFTISSPNTETAKKYLLHTGNSYKANTNLTDGVYFNNTSTDYWDIKSWNNTPRS